MKSRLIGAVVVLCIFGLGGAIGLAARGGRRAQLQQVTPKPVTRGAETAVIPTGQVTLRLQFGNKTVNRARVPTKWDGTVEVSQGGRLGGVEILGPTPASQATENGWRLTTIRVIPRMGAQLEKGYRNMPVQEAWVLLRLEGAGPNTKVDVKTEQGAFSFVLKDVPFGKSRRELNGLVEISRAPNTAKVLTAPTEDDFPSCAYDKDGKLYIAYMAFTHGKGLAQRPRLTEEPKNLSFLATPVGGDQIFLMRLDGDKWSPLMPVTPPGQDVFHPAVAADATGRVWVVWSANVDDNWDLYARSLQGDKWSKTVRLTRDPRPDIVPVAASDTSGRVWIAWQAFRGNNSDILALRQQESGFGEPMVVSDDKANEWDPAIAISPDGDVAFAWDTYRKGDYDVYARVWSKDRLGEPIPIATSLRGESRAGATYDSQGRLWVAYEDSPEKWGKDWGYCEKSGMRLYENRSVGVRVWAGGRLMEPADSPARTFQPPAPFRPQKADKAAERKGESIAAKLAAPRLATDKAGRVWLAVRQGFPGSRSAVGSVWVENLAWYEGGRWSENVFCPNTDNLLDNRPTLAARPKGGLTLVGSTDMRLSQSGRIPPGLSKELKQEGVEILKTEEPESPWPDPVNNEIAMAEIADDSLAPPAAMDLKPVADAAPALMSDEAKSEAEDIARMRAFRATVKGKPHQIMRGEFHRHTEISGDGGGDGMLSDMWRYAHDMADMDWIGCGDHDNGGGREYSWYLTQKTTDMFRVPKVFEPMFTYERSVQYPDGHRNVVFAQRGVRTLPRLQGGMGKNMDSLPAEEAPPHTPDTLLLYRYLERFNGICASHTSGTNMGTDWRDNDPLVEPVVEIYQGCRQNYEMPGAPRSNSAEDSVGGWRPRGFVSLALMKGYRLGFQSSSDHVSTHMSYCNVWVEKPSREAILEGMKRRHVYGATDNIIADFRCGKYFMGDEFTIRDKPTFSIHIIGTKPMAKVQIVKDGKYVYTATPNQQDVTLEWTDAQPQAGKTIYYYARGEQSDGELVWISPMWITYRP